MRILFAGGDLYSNGGVSDYTKYLAKACMDLGHQVFLLSLFQREKFARENLFVPCPSEFLNISESASWQERRKLASVGIQIFKPDFISLQFVPFSFQKKGILHAEVRREMWELFRKFPLHVFFHEMYVSLKPSFNSGFFWLSLFQRLCFREFFNRLRPTVAHTNCSLYRYYLNKRGIAAERLELFGSIPIEIPDPVIFHRIFEEKGISFATQKRSSFLIFGFFGGIHNGLPLKSFFRKLQQRKNQVGKDVIVCSMGGTPIEAWMALEEEFSRDFRFVKFDSQPTNIVSQYLQGIDYGITSYPISCFEKSSALAGLLEHGLPIVFPYNDFSKAELDRFKVVVPPNIQSGFDEFWEKRGVTRKFPKNPDHLMQVARIFSKDLACKT